MEGEQVTRQQIARRIVKAIVADVENRAGLWQAWEKIDPKLRRQIIDGWEAKAREHLEP